MSDVTHSPKTLAEPMLRLRLESFEQTRAFFIQMWLQNPALARQAGERVSRLLAPLPVAPTPTPPASEARP